MRGLFKTILVSSALVLVACTSLALTPESSEAVVALRLAQYAELLQRQDSSAVAAMFEPSGSMAHEGQAPIVGRVAIQAFLESFASYKVLAHKMQLTSAVAHDRAVEQIGRYTQSVVTPEGGTVQVSGTFVAVWRHEQRGQWLIESMRTAPLTGD